MERKPREIFKTRLGFLLIAAGCAVGIGNVWRFPFIVGQYGGAYFVLLYLFFLVTLGIPLLTVELAIGRASRSSMAYCYEELEQAGSRWHINKWWQFSGNYFLKAGCFTISYHLPLVRSQLTSPVMKLLRLLVIF